MQLSYKVSEFIGNLIIGITLGVMFAASLGVFEGALEAWIR